ncbi:MAG: WD40 repeat domain-containing protein [Candidatus Aminicenantes bacterium]|nr:MAG: WD40 repeat domain-containing protein [Candidatus Aminicenantes bacterium]
MKRVRVLFFVITLLAAQALHGVVPQKWEIRSKDEFLKGKLDGISVSYEGVLSLSPKEEEIDAPVEEFYLSHLLTPQGEIFLGTGHSGKIYKIGKKGTPELYFQVPEMDIYCLTQDRRGNLYAGTSPNGKIYKITERGKGSPFFNPREKYIWDLLFSERGVLLAAVGENGGIYEINTEGEGRPVLRAEENHVLCIEKDANQDIIAGTGGRGRVYRISKAKRPSILFESSYEEIRSLVLDKEGNVYAAAGGKIISPKEEIKPPIPVKSEKDVSITVTPTSVLSEELQLSGQKHPGALFKVNSQGVVKKIWQSSDELIYSLSWDGTEEKLLFGTGDKGRVYSVDRNEKISLLIQKDSAQVYSLLLFDEKIYMLANNPPSLSIIHPEQILTGDYLSQVIDTRTVSSWGRIGWESEVPTGCNIQFQTRSGNSNRPNVTWSDWSPPYQKGEGEQILSPGARYLQFRVMFKTQSGKVSPLLRKISLYYLQTNLAPEITKLTLLPPNTVYLKPPIQTEVIWGVDTHITEKNKDQAEVEAMIVPKKAEKKGFQTAVWEANDENGDSLDYSISIRKEDENKWRILKEHWTETIFAFDTLSLPDGVYLLKVVASDSPSNPSGMEFTAEKVARPLVIDNSLPIIKDFKVNRERNKLVVTFIAEDLMSSIQEVKYLIRPGEWKSIFSEDGICDSKEESFRISITLPPQFDDLITVKVRDSYGNIGVHRQTF